MTTIQKLPYVFLLLVLSSCGSLNFLSQNENIEVTLTASQEEIAAGDSVTLTWESKHAENIRLLNGAKKLPQRGSITVAPEETERYLIMASAVKKTFWGREKKIKDYDAAKIEVVTPEIEEFQTKKALNYGDSVDLVWQTENARHVSVTGIDKKLPAEGSMRWSPDTTGWYYITAHGKNIQVQDSLKIQVRAKRKFKTPDKIWLGHHLKFSWHFDKAEDVFITGMGKLPPSGKKKIYTEVDTTLQMVVNYKNWSDTLRRRVKVAVPEIRYFYGPSVVKKSEDISVSWHVEGKPHLQIIDRIDSLPPRGSATLDVRQDTVLTLLAKYPTFETRLRLNVEVIHHRGYVTDSRDRSEIPAGRRIDFDIMEVDTSEYPRKMALKVIAVDEEGNFVKGINENNVSEHIASLYQSTHGGELKPFSYSIEYQKELKNQEVDFGFVFDFSGSMKGNVDSLVKAAEVFFDQKYPQDRISMVKFDNELKKETRLIRDKHDLYEALFHQTIDSMGGGTALYAGTSLGLKTLRKSDRKRILVLFTDGHENSSFAYLGQHAVSALDLAQEARMLGIPLYIISFGQGTNKPLLEALSEITFGQYYQLFMTEQIKQVFEEIRRTSREYYKITFRPLPHDGKHYVQLNYYNNAGGISTANTTANVNGDIKIGEKEIPREAYWKPQGNKTPLMPPQVIANFDFDKDELKPKYHERIKDFISFLKKKPRVACTIHGHTDQVGDWDYCMGLSKRRAQAVADYMSERGIDEERITIKGWGMKHPKWKLEDKDWKARENRRIEIVMYQ